MKCQRCESTRVAEVNAKCSDCCSVSLGESGTDGYVPRDMGVGGDGYVGFRWCLDCGQLQGKFPIAPCKIENNNPVR